MLKDIHTTRYQSVLIKEEDRDSLKDGDIVSYNATSTRWEIPSAGGSNIIFGVVVDDNVGAERRLIAIDGVVEVNVATGNEESGSLVVFSQTANAMTSTLGDYIPNGVIVEKLAAKYGKYRALVNITSNYLFALPKQNPQNS